MATSHQLSSILSSLVTNCQWNGDDVVHLFTALVKRFNDKKDESDFTTWMVKILYQVEIHRISASDLNHDFVDNVEVKISDMVKNTNEKTLDEIMEEISAQENIDKQTLDQVKDIVSSVSSSMEASSATELHGLKQTLFTLCKAVTNNMNMTPRQTQMVSWCILVLSKSSQLVQVGTGEGKSCIVAMFAAYQAMMGKTPDIISSSPVLAERDAEDWSAFYKELNITVDVNSNKSKDTDLKKCYNCQVVYGTTESFAGDWLRHHFHRKDVRNKREFHCVIVDEVDSLMLDKGLEVVYLNTEMPLMECLNGILAKIWFVVSQLKHLDTGQTLGHVQPFYETLCYSLDENTRIDNLSILQMAEDFGITPTGSTQQIREKKDIFLEKLHGVGVDQMVIFFRRFEEVFPQCSYKLFSQNDDETLKELNNGLTIADSRHKVSVVLLNSGMCRVLYSDEDALLKSLVKKFKNDMSSASEREQNESCIPGLQDLINGKLQTWIENALEATKMTLGHEYILHGDGVVPVDFRCTGVVQNNMRWGEGLQQFLEMKHQTKLSNMSLITNLMSNVGLFKQYHNHVYGITGTLGDQTELDMLKKLYNGIQTCKIPSFRRRKLYELEGKVISEEEEWIKTVCDVVQDQVTSTDYRGPRAALVICETINRAEVLHRALAETGLSDKLKLYVNNNMDNSKIVDGQVQEGDVIIATNLAGRGTDLKVGENVNMAGGLFVVQTFLPLNVRVEQQAFGRTARQGSPGSAQLIMCSNHFSESVKLVMVLNTSLPSLLRRLAHLTTTLMSCVFPERVFERAVNVYQQNPNTQNYEATVAALKRHLTLESLRFEESNLQMAKKARNIIVKSRLSRFLEKDIPNIIKKEELFSDYLTFLDKIYENYAFADQREFIVPSLHECWGLWLLMHFSEEKSIENLKEQLNVALMSAKEQLLCKRSPSSMVYYYIRSGNNLRQNGHLAESIAMFTKALEEDSCGEIIPLYNRALATITKKDAGYIAQALADLEKADKAIDSYQLNLAFMLIMVETSSQKPDVQGDTLLRKQFKVKCTVVNLLKANIQDAVMKLKRAESRGGDVNLTEKLALFLVEDYNFTSPRVLKEVLIELLHVISSGLDTVFSLDTIFPLSGILSKILRLFY